MEKDLLPCNFTSLKYGSWQSAIGKEVFKPKRVARTHSGGVLLGVFAWVFLRISSDLRKGTSVIKFT